MKYTTYSLGATQWKMLHALLDDGGALTTSEIAEAASVEPKRARKALVSLEARNLIRSETVPQRAVGFRRIPKTTLWALRIARR